MKAQKRHKIGISKSEAAIAENLYGHFLLMVKQLSANNDFDSLKKSIEDLINSIIKEVCSKGGTLIFYTCKNFKEDYLFAHSLSVCLISVRIGLRLRFDKARLKNLAILSLVHSPETIKHSQKLLNTLEADEQLNQIVKLVDVYDALTHPPAYRHATTPFDTLAAMIKSHSFFGRDLVKLLLEEISLYPRGSWVELSTKEIGKVIAVNQDLPLRPTVKVFVNWHGKYINRPKTIDLGKDNLIYVLRPLTESEIKELIEG